MECAQGVQRPTVFAQEVQTPFRPFPVADPFNEGATRNGKSLEPTQAIGGPFYGWTVHVGLKPTKLLLEVGAGRLPGPGPAFAAVRYDSQQDAALEGRTMGPSPHTQVETP